MINYNLIAKYAKLKNQYQNLKIVYILQRKILCRIYTEILSE